MVNHGSAEGILAGGPDFKVLDVYYNMNYSEQTELKFHITPSTGDNKDQQYVYLDLRLSLPPSYPHVPPQMTITQSRGLADAHIRW